MTHIFAYLVQAWEEKYNCKWNEDCANELAYEIACYHPQMVAEINRVVEVGMASIEVASPSDAWCNCRRCGGAAKTWQIVGLVESGPRYWECVVCGMGEVVSGTPMMFGELFIDQTKEEHKNMFFKSYNAYRKQCYLPLITDEEWDARCQSQ